MLAIQNWQKSFGENIVLNNLSLEVEKGKVLTIIGPSGSGKSTLLRTFNFLEPADSGVLRLDGEEYDVTKISKKDILNIRQKTAMVFQNYALFSKKTAEENVMEALLMVKKLPKKVASLKAKEALEKVGMADFLKTYPHQLSGGQQQRVGIARALALQPKVIFLDEPTSALDPELVKGILDLIQRLAEEKMTLVLVTHEMNFAKKVSDEIIFLEKGVIVEKGTPDAIFNHPQQKRTAEFLNSSAQ